jgi:hypothetical protein
LPNRVNQHRGDRVVVPESTLRILWIAGDPGILMNRK